MKRINSVTDALNTNKVLVDVGDGIVVPLPTDGVFAGSQGAPGVGVPEGGTSGQVVQKTASGTTWATPSKDLVGLSSVDNTADLEKPLSEPQALALTNKADLIDGKVPSSQLPTDALVTDSTVAPLVNGAATGAAIDARINTQVAPQVQKITSDYIAGDRAVVDAAAAAVNASPKITQIEAGKADKVGIRLYDEDLNTVLTPGKYFQPTSATATAARHYPFIGSNGGTIVNVDSYSTTFVNRVQTAFSMDGKNMAIRSIFNNTTWSEWAYFKPWDPTAGVTAEKGLHQHMLRLNNMRHRIGQPRTNGKAAVALIADHGTNNFNEIVVPALRETGVKATIALNSQMYDPSAQRYEHDNRTSWSIIKSWHDELGIEIANHGRTHKDQTTVEAIRTEIVGGRQELESNLPGVNIDTYVQVGLSGTNGFMGHNNGTTLASYYETDAGRIIIDSHALFTGGLGGPRTYALDGNPVQGVSSYWIDAGAANITSAKEGIAEAIAKGRGVTVRFHPELLDTAGYTTSAEIQSFIRYLGDLAKNGSIVPMTFRELSLASSAPDEATTRKMLAQSRDSGVVVLSNPLLTAGRATIARSGAMVSLTLTDAAFGTLAGLQEIPGLIPAGFRPKEWQHFGSSTHADLKANGLIIKPDGALRIYNLTAGEQVQATLTYYASE